MRRLVLFDVDGTLLRAHGLGRRSLESAFFERFGVRDAFASVTFHGRTDYDIVAEGVAKIGAGPHEVAGVVGRYLDHLEREAAISEVTTMPGVLAVLRRLQETPGVMLGLVTGNVKRGAWIKLARDGLRDFFRVGAFGDDHTDRGELVRLARRRAAEAGHVAEGPRSVFHVGDTKNDVLAARAAGAVAVAVSTGGESHEDLEALAPNHLFRSFEPAEAFCAAVLG